MPEMSNAEFMSMLENCLRNSIPITIRIDKNEEEKALITCDAYLNGELTNISGMTPLAIYFIISKLPENKQIEFIKENIEIIEKNDEEIFLYTMLCPKSLAYFLSLKVIKELKNISPKIFKKIISKNYENLFFGFSHSDFIAFFEDFYEEIMNLENRILIEGLYFQSRSHLECTNVNALNENFAIQNQYNKKFLSFFLPKYKEKLSTFLPSELLRFMLNITNIETYKSFVQEHHEKIDMALKNANEYELAEYLSETCEEKQDILFQAFSLSIINTQNIKTLIFKISPPLIIELYKKNPPLFNSLTLKDWIKVCSNKRFFNQDFQNILDTFVIDNIEDLFDFNFFVPRFYKKDTTALEYIELKYRNSLKSDGSLEPLAETTSPFSTLFIKNLNELKFLLKNHSISRNDPLYKKHLLIFILYLKNKNIITSIEGPNFQEIEKLFYRIIMGTSLTILYQVTSIEEITLLNRLKKEEFYANDFTVAQLQNYNVKHHRILCAQLKKNVNLALARKLILKLLLMVGFNHAKRILEIKNSLSVLEHLTGNVDVKTVKLDASGNPILNSKLMNLLFDNKDYTKIKTMLNEQDGELFKYFPRIFNEWTLIEMNKKTSSLKSIIEFLKSDEITVPPKYYRLAGLFKYIGCNNSIVTETFSIHNQMLKRLSCTIPTLSGMKDGYSYEILSSSNMESLTVGNITNCCFTIQGVGYSCLKHAVTSPNGRVFVIKKEGRIIAHSWVWRNGDLLCFDNIEVSKSMNIIDFLDVYLEAADELLKISQTTEGIQNCLKNITIGRNNVDKPTRGIDKFPCLVSKEERKQQKDYTQRLKPNEILIDRLPQPLEEVTYSDSKSTQYLIRGTGNFNLGQSPYYYEEPRDEVMDYQNEKAYSTDHITKMNQKINALRYIKAEEEQTLNSFKAITIEDYKEAYCNDDWYIIISKDNTYEQYINSTHPNVQSEISAIKTKAQKSPKLIKKLTS